MIELRDVTVRHARDRNAHILYDANLRFPATARVGILAAPGTGKSTLARVFAGLEEPHGGSVVSKDARSWPLGFAGFLHPELSIKQNLTLIARLRQVDPADYIARCMAFSDINVPAAHKAKQLTPSQRASLAYACVAILQWDWLIADEMIILNDPILRMKCDAWLNESRGAMGILFLSRNPAQIRKYCDHFLLLIGGQLKPCPDLDAGKEALATFQSSTSERFAHV